MSSVFTVTTNPVQLFLGGQDTLSLVNNGPVTVYLGENSSVSPLNGHPLPPTGQMSWQPQKELWAVTLTDSARLVTSNAAVISNTSRAKYWSTLYSQAYPATAVQNLDAIKIECGQAATLHLNITGFMPDSTFEQNTLNGHATWYAADGVTILAQNQWSTWILPKRSLTVVPQPVSVFADIPVRGAYVELSFTAVNNPQYSVTNITISGSDTAFPFRSWCSNVACGPAQSWSFVNQDDAITFTGGSYSDLGNVWLPSWGDRITVTVYTATPPTSGNLLGIYNSSSAPIALLNVPSGSVIESLEFLAPRTSALYIGSLITNVNVAITSLTVSYQN